MIRVAHTLAAMLATVAPVSALTLEECDRITHVSHAGESDHRDLGAGRVSYVEWWSQEGVYDDVVLANCATATALTTRVREARISERAEFDVPRKALGLIELELTASPSLFSFERLAGTLKRTGRDTKITMLTEEPCACAALYPELRGEMTPFERDQ
jgi:hypothetical protein